MLQERVAGCVPVKGKRKLERKWNANGTRMERIYKHIYVPNAFSTRLFLLNVLAMTAKFPGKNPITILPPALTTVSTTKDVSHFEMIFLCTPFLPNIHRFVRLPGQVRNRMHHKNMNQNERSQAHLAPNR